MEIKPLYQSVGDEASDQLAFFHLLEQLKTQKRTGWLNHQIPHPESISDHMYRMSILALSANDTRLDITKCALMAVVHDLAEAHVGDIAPSDGISKEAKNMLESKAMENMVHVMLHSSPAALRIEALWKEYEEGTTAEAKFVKDLDLYEMALQAMEYEKGSEQGARNLQTFFDSSIPRIRHPEVQKWARKLTEEREEFWKGQTVVVDRGHQGPESSGM